MKRLLGDIRRADEDFHMIARGDRVAVGVSGGKDSLMLLRALAVYSRFAVKPFEVVAITLKTGDPFDIAPIRALCEKLNVPYVVEECDLIHQLFDVRREENPCALCARLRRGALLRMAAEQGCNKLALGHHREDAEETLAALQEMFYACQNDLRGRWTDDELIEYMAGTFNGRAHGSLDYLTGARLLVPEIYFSVGEAESRTRSQRLAGVVDMTSSAYNIAKGQKIDTTMRLNPGGHFSEPEKRCADAVRWLTGDKATKRKDDYKWKA